MTIDITQADRDAEAEYGAISPYADDEDFLAVFARHRIASTEELRAENERLREALDQAAAWFEEYADEHGWKATATSDIGETTSRLDKAKRNQERANFLRAALASNGAAWSLGRILHAIDLLGEDLPNDRNT